MNYFNKKNIVIISIAVLLIINVAVIGTVLFLTYKKPAVTEIQPRESINAARQKLNLSVRVGVNIRAKSSLNKAISISEK